MTSALEKTGLTIREGNEADCQRLRVFLEKNELFPDPNGSIFKSLSKPDCNTFILCDKKSMIQGFIQICSTEIRFIAVDGKYRKKGIGRDLYEHIRKISEKKLPGFYARVESEIARKFWKGVGFVKQNDFYWSQTFERFNSDDKKAPHVKVAIDVYTDRNEMLDGHFETEAYIANNTITLKKHFIHYIQSQDHLLHISINSKKLEPKKIKYAKEYGIEIEDGYWVTISEIPQNNLVE